MGFYPAPSAAIDLLLTRLTVHGEAALLDPCAGCGDAIHQIAQGLGVGGDRIWAIELERARGETLKQNLQAAKVLAPASLFGSWVSRGSFSFTYVNPPFDADSRTNKGRVEVDWLQRCTGLLAPHGIMAFVCPQPTVYIHEFKDWFCAHFDHIAVINFPNDVRKYHEVFVLGVKRRQSIDKPEWNLWEKSQANPNYQYNIPPAPGPEHWVKTELTDEEIEDLVAASPLQRHLDVPPLVELPRPPLALHTGHLALLLACGMLDGCVHPDNGPSHLIRGVARKQEEVTAEEVTETKSETVIKSTFTERIELRVRAVDEHGKLHDLI
jgi:hypothetical protein